MAPKPHLDFKDGDDDCILYIAHDHTKKGLHVVKIGTTELEPWERLQSIQGGFRELIRKGCTEKQVFACYGDYQDWAMDRAWRFNSKIAAEEVEKLSVAIALAHSRTRPLGTDYITHLDFARAETAVEQAIKRVRRTAKRQNFSLQIASERRPPGTRKQLGSDWIASPPLPTFKRRARRHL